MRSCWRLRSPASPLSAHLGEVVALKVVYGGNGVAALERALISRGLVAGDVRASIAGGPDAPTAVRSNLHCSASI